MLHVLDSSQSCVQAIDATDDSEEPGSSHVKNPSQASLATSTTGACFDLILACLLALLDPSLCCMLYGICTKLYAWQVFLENLSECSYPCFKC